MTTAATSLLGLALPVSGELSGTWGDTVNNSLTALLDTAVAGTTTLSTDADVTLSTTTLAANQARQAVLLCTGSRTVLRYITAPAQSKTYVVINSTTGGFAVVIRGVGPTTGITIANGTAALVAWNGSDFSLVAVSVIPLASGVSGVLPVANGGTGATTLTANNVVIGNGTSAVQFVAPSTSGNVLTSTGTAWASSAPFSVVLTGCVATFAGNTAPTGWLKANGAAVSRSTYAALFAYIGTTYGVGDGTTTFNVPDMRGYFARGWVDDGTIDSGRAFGSTQADELKSHTHTIPAVGNSNTGTARVSPSNDSSITSNPPTNATGGTETRPVNVAFLACIKT